MIAYILYVLYRNVNLPNIIHYDTTGEIFLYHISVLYVVLHRIHFA